MPGWYIHMDLARKAVDDLAANATAARIFSSLGLDAAQVRNTLLNVLFNKQSQQNVGPFTFSDCEA